MPCTHPDFDGALFNFRVFLKLGGPTCLGPGASCPLPPLPPSRRALLLISSRQIKQSVFNDFHFGQSLVSVALRLNCPIRFPHHHSCFIQRTFFIEAEEFTFRFILVITNPKFSKPPTHNVNTPWLRTYEI